MLAGRPFRARVLDRRRVAADPARWGGSSSRCGRWAREIDGRDDATRAPLVVRGAALHGLRYELPVASAQVKTAVLLAGLQADGETEVVSPGAEPRSHRADARRARRAARRSTACRFGSRGARRGAFEIDVPGDPSSAAFFAVAAAITPGSDIVLESVSCNPTRIGFVTVLQRMGADIELTPTGEVCGEPVGELRVRASELHGTTIAGDEIPNVIDEIPALAVAAAFADGVTEVRDAAELVVKESNRIGTLHEELGKLGVGVEAAARRSGRAGRAGRGRRVRQPRRPSHRDGDGRRRQRGRRSTRRSTAGAACRRRTPSSPRISARLDRATRDGRAMTVGP